MDTTNQQRILGYFIEEAKEHLQTLEQGILQLSTSAKDAETVNEMFRAAHSVKGGAAMLGYTSIQKTAHRLEDSFKVLKENQINVDSKLENLFLNGYDCLQDLIERLESSSDFSDKDAVEILSQAEDNFVDLQNYLNSLLSGGDSSSKITVVLKQMLQLFKQPDSAENRQKLQDLCQSLAQIAPDQANWQKLINSAKLAVSNKKYPYNAIAQVVIKELKLAGDKLNAGQADTIVPSRNLQQLAATAGGTAASATITIPREPQAAAVALMKSFNKQQLKQICQIISSRL
ncbi:Hpt domain-containing protein [Myxosarcina sp. GI1]|uniref:Hpt domain-containing protein n=1 Tax=Myxosarcina sp. GI1 TaxID=1541065 RepID=UPI00055E34AD|nr:Hpt domain-containing protein [Myxosarcina sp. GI1]